MDFGMQQTLYEYVAHKRTHFNPMATSPITMLSAPIIRIENHRSEVLSCEFHPSGKYMLSSNRGGEIHVSDMMASFPKLTVLKGHEGAVLESHFSKCGFHIYSCSTDGTVGVWDTFQGSRREHYKGHKSDVNCVQGVRSGSPFLCSGSNDRTVRMWDTRERNSVSTFESGAEVTATCFNILGEYIFSGGSDSDIKVWDIRKREVLYKLRGHIGRVTGLSLSPCGRYLLSHSVDHTLRIWNVRPDVTLERDIRCYQSNQQFVDNLLRCAWSESGRMISAGTAERELYVWDSETGNVVLELPGHKSSINDVAFNPREPIILSASTDNHMFLHEM